MAPVPVVRYMILCEDWQVDPQNPRRISITGLITNIRSLEPLPYPLWYRELCVLLILTEGRGRGRARIRCILEEMDEVIFETPNQPILFGPDPLEVVGVPFRISNFVFPSPGLYQVEFWYNDIRVDQRPLRLR